MNERTLAKHLEQFDKKDMAVIKWVLNQTNWLGYQVHDGLLPFVDGNKVLRAIYHYNTDSGHPMSRRLAKVGQQLKELYKLENVATFEMKLIDRLVAKRFGPHPERGVKIPLAPKKRVTVGVRWCLPKRDFEPDDDVLVSPHVVLRCLGRHKWQVSVDPAYKVRIMMHLLQYCS